MRWWVRLAVVAGLLIHEGAFATTISIRDIDDVRKYLKLSPEYDKVEGLDRIRIAVLDKSFIGYDPTARMLPASTVLIDNDTLDAFVASKGKEYSDKYNLYWVDDKNMPYPGNMQETPPFGQFGHGLQMGQIISSVIGKSQPAQPEFVLINTFGDVNWRRAMRYLIEKVQPDIILHSQNFECCTDFDGRGYMDDMVNMVTAEGEKTKRFIWINAVGNYGGRVVNAPIRFGKDNYVIFGQGKNAKNYLEVASYKDQNAFRASLTWNSGNHKLNGGTDKDLDIEFTDYQDIPVGDVVAKDGYRRGNSVGGSGKLMQIPNNNETSLPDGSTYLAQEKIQYEKLAASKPGRHYRLRIKVTSGRFDPRKDQLRIYLNPMGGKHQESEQSQPMDSVAFVNLPIPRGSEVPSPAGNKNVIAVGDNTNESSRGWVDGMFKPDVVFPLSFVTFTDNNASDGVSNSAAYFAGIVALMKAVEPDLTKKHLLAMATQPVSYSPLEETVQSYEQIALERAQRFAPLITQAIRKATNSEFRPYSLNDRKLVLEVPEFNDAIRSYFPRFQFGEAGVRLQDHQFYLIARQSQVQRGERYGSPRNSIVGYTRKRGMGSDGNRAFYPWEVFDGNETDYIEIKLAGTGIPEERTETRVVEGKTIEKKTWITPTRAQLRRFIN